MARKTWRQKYMTRPWPEVGRTDRDFADVRAGEIMLISTPAEIEDEIRHIPRGHELSFGQLRDRLARRHHADKACPVTTGIHLRIVSEVAFEDLQAGKPVSDVAPFWRVVTPGSRIAAKLACGPEGVAALRKLENLPV